MKDMSNEELINKFRAMCSLFIIYGKFQKEQDFNEANKISDELLSRLSTGEEAVKKVAELENEIKEWENSRDGFLLSSQAKNFKIMELEKEAKRKADLFAKKCFECAALKQQDEAGQRALKAMEKFSSEYKQWVSDYPKVVQKSKFFDDLIEMLQHKEAL